MTPFHFNLIRTGRNGDRNPLWRRRNSAYPEWHDGDLGALNNRAVLTKNRIAGGNGLAFELALYIVRINHADYIDSARQSEFDRRGFG